MFEEIRHVIDVSKGEPEALAREIHGIDVSGWQRTINWAQVAASQDFVYLKATEGQDFRDRMFDSHSAGVIAAKTPYGYYHFATPNHNDARGEAEDFVSALEVYKEHWTLPPVLDLEQNKRGMSKAQMVDWCMEFIKVVEEAFSRPVMIYGSPGMLDSYLHPDHPMGDRPLWIAHYGVEAPRVAVGWDHVDIWQYGDSGFRVPGFDDDIDVNKSKVEFLYKYMRPND